jgi:hypothetical protein
MAYSRLDADRAGLRNQIEKALRLTERCSYGFSQTPTT